MSLNFALDFDDTFTKDPELWYNFIDDAQRRGHNVYVVTLRDEKTQGREVKEALQSRADGLFFTSLKSKRKFMQERGIRIHVWIDDKPDYIVDNF